MSKYEALEARNAELLKKIKVRRGRGRESEKEGNKECGRRKGGSWRQGEVASRERAVDRASGKRPEGGGGAGCFEVKGKRRGGVRS
eukprot:3155218-Pleurochrysis_carterae.AAC.1